MDDSQKDHAKEKNLNTNNKIKGSMIPLTRNSRKEETVMIGSRPVVA